MAYVALASMIVFTGLFMYTVPVEKISKIGDVIQWFYMAMSGIILGYMGQTGWAAVAMSRNK